MAVFHYGILFKWLSLTLFIILLGNIQVYGQKKQFTNLESLANKDGLDVIKDKYGFIWIAHNSGVLRYDGYDVVEYDIKEGNPNIIQLEAVWDMFLDNKEQLWIGGGNKGCAVYNYEKERFHHYDSAYADKKISLRHVKDFLEDKNGSIWVGSDSGLFYKEVNSEHFERAAYFGDDGVPIGVIHSLFLQDSTRIWIGNGNGNLYIFDLETNKIERYKKGVFHKKSASQNKILHIFQDSKNYIWICGDLRALRIDPVTGEQFSILDKLLDPNKVTYVNEDPGGNLWFSAGGINIYNPATGTMEYHLSDKSVENTLSSNVTNKIYIDNQGIYWIGSWYGGIDTYSSTKNPFKHYMSVPSNPNSLSDNISHCFYEDEDRNIWIGTEDGLLNKLNPRNGNFTHYRDESMAINEAVTGIVTGTNKDEFILGTWGAIKAFNRQTGSFERITQNNSPHTSVNTRVASIIAGDSNNVWYGVEWGGLDEIKLEDRSITHHASLAVGSCIEDLSYIRHLFFDNYGYLWIVGWAALIRYDIEARCFYRLKQDNNDPYALNEGQVYYCFQDSKNRLWIGNTKGIDLYNYSGDYFINFGHKYGLEGTEVIAIQEDKEGNLWLSTDKGISKFMLPAAVDTITKDSAWHSSLPKDFIYFLNYDKYDGIQDAKFLKGSLYASDGTMYFSGTGGINSFKPEDIKQDTISSPIRFIEFSLFNKVIKPKNKSNPNSPLDISISLIKKITLNHNQYIFSLKWAALNYYAPQKVKYAYIMEGFDKEWNYVGNKRMASFTGLPPGNYKFRVKATNSDGVWNQEEASLGITILPPWWKTWLFRLLIGFTLLGIVIAFYFIRIRTLEIRTHNLEAMIDDRTKDLQTVNITKDKFFSIIAHDLKNPFHAILGISDLLLNYNDDFNETERIEMYSSIQQVSQRTYDLLENLLTWSRAQSGAIQYQPERIDVKKYIQSNILLLHNNASKKEIAVYNNVISDLFVRADINTADTIMRNLITNAIKFTPRKGSITISATATKFDNNPFILFRVKDSGIGMSSKQVTNIFRIDRNTSRPGTEKEPGTGLGLVLCKEFVENNGGTIWVESEKGKGSTFFFTLPQDRG